MADKSFCATGSTSWTPYECLVNGTSVITEDAIHRANDVDLHGEIARLRDALSNYHQRAHPELSDRYKEGRKNHLFFNDPITYQRFEIEFNGRDEQGRYGLNVRIHLIGRRHRHRVYEDLILDETGIRERNDDTMKEVLYMFKHLYDAGGVQVLYRFYDRDNCCNPHRDRVFLTWKTPSYMQDHKQASRRGCVGKKPCNTLESLAESLKLL